MAAQEGHASVVDYLVGHGADHNIATEVCLLWKNFLKSVQTDRIKFLSNADWAKNWSPRFSSINGLFG